MTSLLNKIGSHLVVKTLINMLENIKPNKSESLPNEAVVAHNLEMLNRDMINLLNVESIGGNAGTADIDGKKYSCGTANGYANPQTGQIIVFDNIQDIRDKKIIEENAGFTLRVAINWQAGKFVKIVDFFTERYGKIKLSDQATLAIEIAINRWNAEQKRLIPSTLK